MQAPRPGKMIVQDNALKPQGTLTLNVSTITTGCFQMNLVCSVNVRGKVWEIKKIDERLVISHQHKKVFL
jgi:hypothetical protein